MAKNNHDGKGGKAMRGKRKKEKCRIKEKRVG